MLRRVWVGSHTRPRERKAVHECDRIHCVFTTRLHLNRPRPRQIHSGRCKLLSVRTVKVLCRYGVGHTQRWRRIVYEYSCTFDRAPLVENMALLNNAAFALWAITHYVVMRRVLALGFQLLLPSICSNDARITLPKVVVPHRLACLTLDMISSTLRSAASSLVSHSTRSAGSEYLVFASPSMV